MLRKSIFLALVVALAVSSAAQAAILGTATLKGNPPGVAFTSPDQALAAPWQSYALDLASNAGELIGGIDVVISGQLHQRWTFDEDAGAFIATGNSANTTNGDSHLRAVTGAIFGAGPTEDNPGTGSPLANTATAQYGVGTSLSGAWGITAAASTASLAYIVIPANSIPTLNIAVKVADPGGNIIGDLNCSSFFGAACSTSTDTVPPVITPQVVNFDLDSSDPSLLTNLQLTGSDNVTPVNDLVWSALTYAGGPGKAFAGSGDATMNADGQFSWVPNGWKEGAHTFNATLADAAGNTVSSLALTVNLTVPEPGTMALFGLAIAGVVGFGRRRS
jgi:hypothetical protein